MSEKAAVKINPQTVSEDARPVQETESKPQPKPVLAPKPVLTPKPVERVVTPPVRPAKSIWRGFAGQDKRRYDSLKRALSDAALSRYGTSGQSIFTDAEWKVLEQPMVIVAFPWSNE